MIQIENTTAFYQYINIPLQTGDWATGQRLIKPRLTLVRPFGMKIINVPIRSSYINEPLSVLIDIKLQNVIDLGEYRYTLADAYGTISDGVVRVVKAEDRPL